MPGLNRYSSPTRVSSTSSSPRSSGHIQFAETLVTGVSRRVYIDEENTIWDFEFHASRHDCCRNPRSIAAAGKELCPEGRLLAIRVAELLFSIRKGDKIFHKSTDGQEVRIEVPDKYNNAISLLWAIRDYGHGILKPNQASYDRTYPISARTTSRQHSVRHPEEPIVTYSTRTVEPESPRRHKSHRSSPPRGSLYALDEEARIEDARRERSARYNIEVREPHYRRYYR